MLEVRQKFSRAALALFCFLLCTHALSAQKVYTKLTDPEQIKSFTVVSRGIACQCGCGIVLANCPHADCGFGIPIRRFVEDRVVAGMHAEEILKKLESGFGEGILADARVREWRSTGREDLVKGVVSGFGAKVSARFNWPVLVILSSLFLALAVFLFLKWRQRRPASGETDSKPDAKITNDAVNRAVDSVDELER